MHFRRTATVDTTIRGWTSRRGKRSCCGTRRATTTRTCSPTPRFDITRENAKTHLSFGAGGTHFCVGAALGRQMLRAGLTEVYRRCPDLALVGDPVVQQNNFMNGIHALPVRWRPVS
jgi:cytochrome P450